MEKITSETFDEIIKEGITFVDFYADWCGPCKMMAPIIEEVESEMNDVKFVKVNVDEENDLAMRFHVMSIPMLALFKDGKLVQDTLGYNPKEALIAFIKRGM